jgi:glutathione S-transferase
MKLFSVNASPFARKARVLIIELGLQDRVAVHSLDGVTPVSNNVDLNAVNPLGMIPALQLDDGSSLYDSPLICEYLDQVAGGGLFPADAERRFRTLELQALADGLLDLSVALRYETALRPEALRWADWIDHQNEKIARGLDVLEQKCSDFADDPLIGELAVACALGYLDFRFSANDWRAGRPALTAWFEQVMQRPSLAQTVPE